VDEESSLFDETSQTSSEGNSGKGSQNTSSERLSEQSEEDYISDLKKMRDNFKNKGISLDMPKEDLNKSKKDKK
jgi:hypothetical protein